MSSQSATAFLERAETDEKFASELESLKDNEDAVYNKVRAEGFDASPEEIKEAFMDRYGAELTTEQLDAIAAGMDGGEIAGIAVGATVGTAAVVAVCAAFAA